MDLLPGCHLLEFLKRDPPQELRDRLGEPLSAIALQLYWTLYTGVLTFWSDDKSPHQEDTLALLDQSLQMFVAWLGPRGDRPGGTDAKTDGEDARQQD